MFRRVMNTVLATVVPFVVATPYWDFIKVADSIILFGEPEYPSENN